MTRAVALSNPQVARTLSRYFVPVFCDILRASRSTDTNSDAIQRMRQEVEIADLAGKTGLLGVGPQSEDSRLPPTPKGASDPEFAFIVAFDGRPIRYVRTELLTGASDPAAAYQRLLDDVIEKLHLQPGEALAPPHPPVASKDEMLLHIVTRFRGQPEFSGREGQMILAQLGAYGLPGEAWIHLPATSWRAFLPPLGATAGTTWEIPPEVSRTIYLECYPPTEASSPDKTEMVSQSLHATLTGEGRVRLLGGVKLRHPWWNGADALSQAPPAFVDEEKYAESTMVGYVDIDAASQTITTLRMASERSTYFATNGSVRAPFAIAVSNI